jgi:hypothetical protein
MKHLPPAASVTPWLYWSIFPVHCAFLKLYFGQIVTKGLENLPESGRVVLALFATIKNVRMILKKRSLISHQYPASIDIRGTFFSAST